ncbi:MAG: helix-turn-helix transcriptional regulator [Lachnospiraceae bacterium]|nr:helix-turn-helix transcriptional regulator [Lachnospiraceae bacterium]MDD6504277.1 helix-turn-helix transcriptional regulator [Lachnospiraceae bacterium]
MDKKKTGNLIKEARTKKKYTQSELGDLLGVSNKAVSRWEKGETFPDAGILENLAAVLDVRIQDIVTGGAEVNNDGAKLLQNETQRNLIRNSLLIAVILCCFISGCSALSNKCMFDSPPVYIIFMVFSFALTLVGCALQNDTDKKKSNKFCRCTKIVALISFLWIILLTWCVFIMFINGHIPFGMELSSIGPFINWQLIGLFTLNLAMNVLEIFRYKRCDEAIHRGWFISIATMYLTVLYGDLLHRMISIQGAMESLIFRTVIVVIVTGISLVVAKIIKDRELTKSI